MKKIIEKSFFKITNLDYIKFLEFLPQKKNIILDFGCGNGIFPKEFFNKKIKSIRMFDKNKSLKLYIKNKYKKNSYISWTNTLKINYNIVFMNSTIQYLTLKNYRILISTFFKKKVDVIIISDIPKYPYYIEAFFCLFINLRKVIKSISYLFHKDYNFYTFKKKDDLIINNSNYSFKFCNNINKDKLLRYSLVFHKKH